MVLRIRGRQTVYEPTPYETRTRYDRMSTEDLKLMLESSLADATHELDEYRRGPEEADAHLYYLIQRLEAAKVSAEALYRKNVVTSPKV